MHPGHFVGRMGKVIIKLCNGATQEASALLKPCPQVLGPLGIIHLLEGITSSILLLEAELAKVIYHLPCLCCSRAVLL